jgi:hypothetical protein
LKHEGEKAEIARLSSFVGELVKSTLGSKSMNKILVSVGCSERQVGLIFALCLILLTIKTFKNVNNFYIHFLWEKNNSHNIFPERFLKFLF